MSEQSDRLFISLMEEARNQTPLWKNDDKVYTWTNLTDLLNVKYVFDAEKMRDTLLEAGCVTRKQAHAIYDTLRFVDFIQSVTVQKVKGKVYVQYVKMRGGYLQGWSFRVVNGKANKPSITE